MTDKLSEIDVDLLKSDLASIGREYNSGNLALVYIAALEQRVEGLDYIAYNNTEAFKRIHEAATQAEMLLDGMSADGIRNSLSLPVQQLYSSTHIALQKALAAEENRVSIEKG